jgi:hypothetical protein
MKFIAKRPWIFLVVLFLLPVMGWVVIINLAIQNPVTPLATRASLGVRGSTATSPAEP